MYITLVRGGLSCAVLKSQCGPSCEARQTVAALQSQYQFYRGADPTGEKSCMYYKVQSGDSMATIGSVFNIPQLDIEVRCTGTIDGPGCVSQFLPMSRCSSPFFFTYSCSSGRGPYVVCCIPGPLPHAERQPWRGACCPGGWLLCEAAPLGQELPGAWRHHQLPCVSGKESMRVPCSSKYTCHSLHGCVRKVWLLLHLWCSLANCLHRPKLLQVRG